MIIAATTLASQRGRPAFEGAHHSRRRVSSTSGTSANGMPKERTTWLTTSDFVGVEPDREHHERRRHRHEPPDTSGIERRMKPCMTTWPA